MEWWGYVGWATIAYLSGVTTKERIGNVEIPVKKYRLFVWLDKVRIGILVVVVAVGLPASLWEFAKWFFSDFAPGHYWFSWIYHGLGLR